MRRWKLPLLIIAIAAVYSVGVLYYLSRMPSQYAIMVYSARALLAGEGDYGQYLYGLQDMRLEPADAPEGQRLSAQGISLVVNTQEPVVEKDNKGYNVFFHIGEKRGILFQSMEADTGNDSLGLALISQNIKDEFQHGKARTLFEHATGKSPDSEYVWEEAIRDVTIWDFSLFDNTRNMGVLTFLSAKSALSEPGTRFYRLDNGKVIGLVERNKTGTLVLFFSPEDLNTWYDVALLGEFTLDEAKAILRTVSLAE